MITRCPGCLTVFRLSADHLKMAHGQVQCGLCNLQFDAIENLLDEATLTSPRPASPEMSPAHEEPAPKEMPEWAYDDLPSPVTETADAPEPDDDESPRIAVEALEEHDADLAIREFEEELEALKRVQEVVEERPVVPEEERAETMRVVPPVPTEDSLRRAPDADEILLSDLPHVGVDRDDVEALRSYLRESAERDRAGSPWWGVASALLLIVLLGQAAWYQRERIFGYLPGLHARWQAWCEGKSCALPQRRDIGLLHVVSRDVRDHPQFKDALLVNATIVNDADFTQPYPVVELTLFDQAGVALGVRRFEPREFLDVSVDIDAGMRPRQSIYVVLEIAGTSSEAVSFEFKFL